jgi:hypothetical protein
MSITLGAAFALGSIDFPSDAIAAEGLLATLLIADAIVYRPFKDAIRLRGAWIRRGRNLYEDAVSEESAPKWET